MTAYRMVYIVERKEDIMSMYAVKEANYCGYTGAKIKSEHGCFECIFKDKDNLEYHLSFNSTFYAVEEHDIFCGLSWVENSIAGVINKIEIFSCDDMAISLEEYSELCKLCASAVAYLNS